jgi:hypothetical protein
MVKQLAKYGAGLIGLYIVVANCSNFGQVMTAGANGGTQLIRGLQGR